MARNNPSASTETEVTETAPTVPVPTVPTKPYLVLGYLSHDMKDYKPGDRLELPEAEAAMLLQFGVVQLVEG